eukprot:CAMPEP_0171676148 /NCGR_PEP_ID=MMETSP0990-20121206/54244_1 /TAXON_ID=483369 /ORGANISM="non described non described, Strain CCMP2098" /LENGTH=69 /DNA_ID=CAMNT_0012262237 /DNA_START=33 /DNA_END=242 /DNA_ORIENTATION=+
MAGATCLSHTTYSAPEATEALAAKGTQCSYVPLVPHPLKQFKIAKFDRSKDAPVGLYMPKALLLPDPSM